MCGCNIPAEECRAGCPCVTRSLGVTTSPDRRDRYPAVRTARDAGGRCGTTASQQPHVPERAGKEGTTSQQPHFPQRAGKERTASQQPHFPQRASKEGTTSQQPHLPQREGKRRTTSQVHRFGERKGKEGAASQRYVRERGEEGGDGRGLLERVDAVNIDRFRKNNGKAVISWPDSKYPSCLSGWISGLCNPVSGHRLLEVPLWDRITELMYVLGDPWTSPRRSNPAAVTRM